MNATARPWIALCFKLMAVLALIFAFIFFMRMQEEQSANDDYRDQGVVSRALITEKSLDEQTNQHSGLRRRSSGYTTTTDLFVLSVRHVPKSDVAFADFPGKVAEADLPVAPAPTGDPMADSAFGGVMFVPESVYRQVDVGDMLTVVNTPWDSSEPVLVADVNAFDASGFYPGIAISLVLTVLFWLIGWRMGRAGKA